VVETMELFRQQLAERGIELVAQADAPVWVRADPGQLRQVLWNLLGNAADATSRGGRVEVRILRQAGEGVLEVSDTGHGIADEEQSMRVMLEARLTKAGHAVEVAADVPGVERALAASEFDVVITDLRMRTGDDGLRVLRKVKDAEAEVEVILMTAFGSDDVRQKALELGAYGYVEKSPTLAAELIALVKAALQKRELARQGRILAQDNELLREQLSARGRFESM